MKKVLMVLMFLLFSFVSVNASPVNMYLEWDTYKSVSVKHNGNNRTVGTTQFNVKFDYNLDNIWDLNTFGYCIDLDKSVNNKKIYSVNLVKPDNNYLFASWLIDEYGDDARTNKDKQAALQLSIWETVYGDFFHYTPTGTIGSFYQLYYNSIPGFVSNLKHEYMIAKHVNGNYQDVIVRGNPIPEPTTLFLTGLGLLSIAGISRRKLK